MSLNTQINNIIYSQMKREEPVVIPSNNDQQQIRDQCKEKLQKSQFGKMIFDKDFDIQIEVAKYFIEGSEEEKDQAIKSRILKFFNYNNKIDLVDGYFMPKLQANHLHKLNPNQLILFGVDFLKIKTLRKMFPDAEISCINDSNCKLTFSNAHQAKQMIKKYIKNQYESQQLLMKVENKMSEDSLPKGWIQLKPYYQLNFQRKLFVRYATQQEKTIKKQQCNNYTAYQNAKKKFTQDLLKSKQIKDKYQQIMTRRERQFTRIQKNIHSTQRQRSRQPHIYRKERWNQSQNIISNTNQNNNYARNTRKNLLQQQVNRKKIDNMPFDGNDDQLSFSGANSVSIQQVHGISWINNDEDSQNLSLQMDKEQENSRQDFSKTIERLSMENDIKSQNLEIEQKKQNHILQKQYKNFNYSLYIKQTQKKQKEKSQIDIVILDD